MKAIVYDGIKDVKVTNVGDNCIKVVLKPS